VVQKSPESFGGEQGKKKTIPVNPIDKWLELIGYLEKHQSEII